MKKKPNNVVPRIRFPEFCDTGDWKIYSIDELAKVTTGNKDTQNKVENGNYPFFVRSQTVERINSFSYDGEAILTSGDGVGVGKNFHYIAGKFDFHQRVYCICDFKSNVLGKFLYLYFLEHFHKRVMQLSAKNSVDSVRRSMITEMPILLPLKKQEQKKITDCLSSIDDLIVAQDQKVDALKKYKKGLMQQLFPCEGETTPRLRFPEFQNAVEWEEKLLSDIIQTIIPSKKIPATQYCKVGYFPVIDQSQNQIAGWIDDKEAVIDKGLPLIIFGDHTCVLKIINKPFAQGADGIKIFRGSSEVITEYLYQYLRFAPQKMEEYKRHFSILKSKKVFYPDRESGEQQKIAACLSSLDNLITSQSQKLNTLRDHKKGLMQQLFPTVSEVQE